MLGGWTSDLFNTITASTTFAAANPEALTHILDVIRTMTSSYLTSNDHWNVDDPTMFEASIADAIRKNGSKTADRAKVKRVYTIPCRTSVIYRTVSRT